MNDTKNKIVELNLNDILPNRFQPRIQFNEEAIIGLSDSIREHGVLEPIIVRPIGDKYEIVAGERRYKACVLANLETIPARIVDMNDHDSVEIALIENVQRRDLTPIEEAISYNRILDMGYLTQEQLAQKLGKSQSTIANKKRLLNLCDEVQEALMEEKISERHARSLLKLSSADAQRKMLNRIINERLTVRHLDEEIDKEIASMTPDEQLEEVANTLLKVEDSVPEDSVIDISTLFDDDVKPLSFQTPSSTLEPGNTSMSSDAMPAVDTVESSSTINELSSSTYPDVVEASSHETSSTILDSAPALTSIEIPPLSLKPDDDVTSISTLTSPGEQFNQSLTPSFDDIGSSSDLVNISQDFSTESNTKTTEVSTPYVNASKFSKFFDPTYFTNEPEYQQASVIAPILEEPNQVLNDTEEVTMFPNLMNNNQISDNNNIINQDDLDNFLDPSIIDGQKQEVPENIGIIDASVFAKFLDPDYDINSTDNEIKEKEEVKSMSFAQYLNNNNDSQTGMNTTQSVQTTVMPQESPAPLNDIMMPQSMQVSQTPAAPQGNTMSFDMPKPDLMATMDSSGFSIPQPEVSKPDLLSPQSSFPMPSMTDVSGGGQTLTPDISFGLNQEDTTEEISQEESYAIPTQPEQSGFVMATDEQPNYSMPSTPILDTNSSALFQTPTENEVESQPNLVETSLPVEPTEQIVDVPPVSNDSMPLEMENQPIIITDYNKQYDPILPDNLVPQEPKVDLRQIIDMIRNLSYQIEDLGFKIDTEEIDLEDSYQVTFVIEKKD